MKMLNQVKMTFASRSVNESFSRAALAAFLAQADPTVPQLADIKTAVSEAVTNCCKFQEVSSYDTMDVTSTDTSWRFRGNTTWSHSTDTTADTLLTEFTMWSLVFYTELPCVSSNLCTCLQKSGSSLFKLFHCS